MIRWSVSGETSSIPLKPLFRTHWTRNLLAKADDIGRNSDTSRTQAHLELSLRCRALGNTKTLESSLQMLAVTKISV